MRRDVFRSVPVAIGDSDYSAIVRVSPMKAAPHYGPDHPRYMEPGRRAYVQIIRILRNAEDVTDDITAFTRTAIEDAVREKLGALARMGR